MTLPCLSEVAKAASIDEAVANTEKEEDVEDSGCVVEIANVVQWNLEHDSRLERRSW
jgi:hypothetical protein